MAQLTKSLLVVALLLLPVFKAGAQTVQSKGTVPYSTLIYKGEVVAQNWNCSRDGTCSFDVKTEDTGVIDFIWNKGESQPDFNCELMPDLEDKAQKLKLGDKIEIHVRSNANNVLCGQEAAIILLK